MARRVISRLSKTFAEVVKLEPLFWEHEPILAVDTFQTQIPDPAETDIVVAILWSRLGTRLPPQIHRTDGSQYSSGTEYEIERAIDSYRKRRTPDLLVYRKLGEPVVPLKDKTEIIERFSQKEALEEFVQRWFHGQEGTIVLAYHSFEDSGRFEDLLEEHLKKLIERRLKERGVTFGDARESTLSITWTEGSPFRGLSAFEYEHAAIFYGRSRATSEVINTLRKRAIDGCPFILLLGMSGCGKSSLVRAGILPLLTQPGVIEGIGLWRYAAMKPSETTGDLFDGLASALLKDTALPELACDGTTASQLAATLRENPASAYPLVKGALAQAALSAKGSGKPPEARFALVLDQLEEVFTRTDVTPEQRARFFESINSLVRSGRAWVIGIMRSDYYPRCSEVQTLSALKEGSGQYDVLPPSPAEIAQMIRRPALSAGLLFEKHPKTHESLDEVILAAASSDPASLPLLEFTLEELYKKRQVGGLLTFAAYEELGGVEGSLANRADEVFRSLDMEAQKALPRVLRALVTAGSHESRPARKVASLARFREDAPALALVNSFVEARLFASDIANDGTPLVCITHEALILRWKQAQDWLSRDRELLVVSARVSASAARWAKENRSSDLLLPSGKPLEEAEHLFESGFYLQQEEIDHIRASQRRFKRTNNIKRAAVAALAVLALIATFAAVAANSLRHEADAAKFVAQTQEKNAQQAALDAQKERDEANVQRERATEALLKKQIAYFWTLQEKGDSSAALLNFATLLHSVESPSYALRNKSPYTLALRTAIGELQRAMPELTYMRKMDKGSTYCTDWAAKQVAFVAQSGNVEIRSISDWNLIYEIPSAVVGDAMYLEFSDSSNTLLVFSDRWTTLRVFSLSSRKQLLDTITATQYLRAHLINDTLLYVSSAQSVELWNIATSKKLLALTYLPERRVTCTFGNMQYLAVALNEAGDPPKRTLLFYDLQKLEAPPQAIDYSTNGEVTAGCFLANGDAVVSTSEPPTIEALRPAGNVFTRGNRQSLPSKVSQLQPLDAVLLVHFTDKGVSVLSPSSLDTLIALTTSFNRSYGYRLQPHDNISFLTFTDTSVGAQPVIPSERATLSLAYYTMNYKLVVERLSPRRWLPLSEVFSANIGNHIVDSSFSPDCVATLASTTGYLYRWDCSHSLAQLLYGSPFSHVSLAPDCRQVGILSKKTLSVVPVVPNGGAVIDSEVLPYSLVSGKFSDDGQKYIAYEANDSWYIKKSHSVLLNVATRKHVTLPLSVDRDRMVFSPDSRCFAYQCQTMEDVSAYARQVELLTCADLQPYATVPVNDVSCYAFSSNSKELILMEYADSSTSVKQWSVAGKRYEDAVVTLHNVKIVSLEIAPDGMFAVTLEESSAEGGCVARIRRTANWEVVGEPICISSFGSLMLPGSWKTCYSDDSRYVCACAFDGFVRVFELATGRLAFEVWTEGNFPVACFLNNDRYLAVSTGSKVRIWDIALGIQVAPDIVCPGHVYELLRNDSGVLYAAANFGLLMWSPAPAQADSALLLSYAQAVSRRKANASGIVTPLSDDEVYAVWLKYAAATGKNELKPLGGDGANDKKVP
ncbi:MAG: hypothetical protein WC712_02800 [Candidatus Brocadiia bacterium]